VSPDQRPNPGSWQPAPRRRLATGLGNEELERRLLPALIEAGYEVLERCLTAEQLLDAARRREVDALLLSGDLYRLTPATAAELLAARKPVVVTGSTAPFRDRARGGWLAAPDEPQAVLAALASALNGEASVAPPPAEEAAPGPEALAPDVLSSVITVASGSGSPGRTTVAVNLAAALGACAPVALVDADLAGPSVAAYLDVNPSNNLYMVVHGRPETSRDWAQALQQELQPLGPRSPHAMVLCGIPKPEMNGRLTLPLFERLLLELQQRYRYVIVDVGAGLSPADVIHRAAVAQAGQLLVVASGDIPGLWHLRRALRLLREELAVDDSRLAVVLNRYERHFDYRRGAIEWALQLPLAAMLPYDHRRARAALAHQQPLVWRSRRGAAGALLELSERIYGGQVRLPAVPEHSPARWRRLRPSIHLPRLGGRQPEPLVMPDGSSVPAAG